MNTIALDTHKTIKNLTQKGFTQEQAEGVVEALAESELVTKSDLHVALSDQKTSIIQWVAALLIAQAGLVVALQNLLS